MHKHVFYDPQLCALLQADRFLCWEYKELVILYAPVTLLSSIMHPPSPNVTITNLIFGNLKSIETSALETDGASVHAYQMRNKQVQFRYYFKFRVIMHEYTDRGISLISLKQRKEKSKCWKKVVKWTWNKSVVLWSNSYIMTVESS